MNSQGNKPLARRLALSGVLVFASLLGTALAGSRPAQAAAFDLIPAAQAEEGGHSSHSGGGHSGGGRGGGGHSSDHAGHDDADGHESGGGGRKGQGRGQGGSHDAARGGKAVEDQVLRGGGKPWAREGIPEVELGRLNVARAPGHVLARAEQEALATHTPNMAVLYNLNAEEAAALLQAQFADVERYDSPLQNLALYKDIMTFGATQMPGVTPASQLDLAAIFLGSASDKTIPISEDTVTAVNRILGLVELKPADRATLASKAETVRAAILTGHGPVTEH